LEVVGKEPVGQPKLGLPKNTKKKKHTGISRLLGRGSAPRRVHENGVKKKKGRRDRPDA